MTKQQLIYENVQAVKERIENAAKKAGRNPEDIHLVAATKMNDAECVKAAIKAGIKIAGENRVQELVEKYEQNAYEGANLHFIGSLQTNKVKFLVGKVQLIQSVDSEKLAGVIAKYAQKNGICQDILLEVNIAKETSKSGIYPEALPEIIENLCNIDGLRIRGLMAIPPISHFIGENLCHFDKMRELFIDISQKKYDNVSMDFLSMGMSGDFEDAISCGSNMVRVGTAIFGARPYMIK